MEVGDVVKLAKWCKNGPALMHVLEIKYSFIKAMYLSGERCGTITDVSKGNAYTLEKYDEAMEKHDARYRNR